MKEHDLEYGYPKVVEAIERLKTILRDSKKNKDKVFVIIHGYGSSGVGGKIKKKVHELLEEEKKLNHIKIYIKGENFNMFNEEARLVHMNFPDTKKYYNKNNDGITIVTI